jgi:hypothetical protein
MHWVIRNAAAEAAADRLIAADFSNLGVKVEGAWDFVKRGKDDRVRDPKIQARLAYHLEQDYPDHTLSGLGLALCNRAARPLAFQPLLRMLYKYRHHVISQDFLNALAEMAEPGDAELVERIILEKSILAAGLMIPAYVKCTKKNALPVLLKLLDSEEKSRVLLALKYIAKFADVSAIAKLEPLTKVPDKDVRKAAQMATEKLKLRIISMAITTEGDRVASGSGFLQKKNWTSFTQGSGSSHTISDITERLVRRLEAADGGASGLIGGELPQSPAPNRNL